MQLSLLKALFIVGTLAGVVFADGGSYHRYGYKHKGYGVIKRTILIDGCTGKPVTERPEEPEVNYNGDGDAPNTTNTPNIPNRPDHPNIPNGYDIPKTLSDLGLEQYADEIKELSRQLGLPDIPV